MCCIVMLMGLIGPRVAFLYAWIFTNEVDQAFNNFFVAAVGLIFLPWTALFFAIAYAPIGGVSGIGYVFVFFGLMLDIGTYAAGPRSRATS